MFHHSRFLLHCMLFDWSLYRRLRFKQRVHKPVHSLTFKWASFTQNLSNQRETPSSWHYVAQNHILYSQNSSYTHAKLLESLKTRRKQNKKRANFWCHDTHIHYILIQLPSFVFSSTSACLSPIWFDLVESIYFVISVVLVDIPL